jgi:hypothetical protein
MKSENYVLLTMIVFLLHYKVNIVKDNAFRYTIHGRCCLR